MSVHLLSRCRFQLIGSDRVRYLNGQVTNQVENLPPNTSRYSLITNHKGQLEADLHIAAHPTEEALLIDAPLELEEALFTRLDRYIIADDVELTDITADWKLLHLLGDDADVPKDLPTNLQTIRSNRFGIPGLDLWIPPSETDATLALFQNNQERTPGALDHLRISHGIPVWGKELTPGLLAPEARLESQAIDFEKGCYIGQEIISRVKSVGKTNRLLTLFSISPSQENPPEPLDTPLPIWHPDANEADKPIGSLTSIATHGHNQPSSEILALGFLKSQHATNEGAQVKAGSTPNVTHTLTVLPFPRPSLTT